MNEQDPETITLRAAEAELRKLYALRNRSITERQTAIDQAPPAPIDVGAAMVARAMAGDDAGAASALQTAIHAVGRVEYLTTLIRALDGQIETQGFKVTELTRLAVAANEPRVIAARVAAAAARLRAHGTFKDDAQLPSSSNDILSGRSYSR